MTGGTVERNRRASRWVHASVYLLSLLLRATGLWLLLGREGNPSVLARATGLSDAVLHRWLGYALALVGGVAIVVWWRALRRFATESVRWDRGDSVWLMAWPRAAFTGRFRRHEGDFDPGQRLANLVLVAILVLLVLSGLVLTTLHGGPAFVVAHRVHLWSTYAFTVMVVGHVVVASGVLPGYRGAWRAMHLGGLLRRDVASRLWPAWVERNAEDGDGRAAPASRVGDCLGLAAPADTREFRCAGRWLSGIRPMSYAAELASAGTPAQFVATLSVDPAGGCLVGV